MQTIYKPKGKYWDKAWSLVEGCTPVSPACDSCWLASIEYRFHANLHVAKAVDTGRVSFTGIVKARPDRLDIPLKTRKPTTFAIWSDLFHEQVSEEFILQVGNVTKMARAHGHNFLILTKRPERMAKFFNEQTNKARCNQAFKQDNVFLGTTVENQEMADKRIPELLKCKPFKLFLSVEPMLSAITLPWVVNEWGYIKLNKLFSCVIAGCESGHHKRETKEEWFRDLREQCIEAGVPFFLKQPVELQHLSTAKVEDLWK